MRGRAPHHRNGHDPAALECGHLDGAAGRADLDVTDGRHHPGRGDHHDSAPDSFTLKTAGVYHYHCTYHQSIGMVGTITVT